MKYGLVVFVLCFLGCQNTQIKQNPMEPKPGVKEQPNVPERQARRETSPPSPGVWGALGVIDIHAHIGSYRGFNLSTPNLMSNIQSFGVSLALISNIDGAKLIGVTKNLDEVRANQATMETVRAYPKQLRGVAWSRPNDGSARNIEPFLKRKLASGERIFVAMKFHPEMNQFVANSSKIDGYMKLCEKYKLAAVFHNGGPGSSSSPELIYKAAQRFPKVAVVLYHMGFGGQHQASIDVVKKSLQKKNATLYLGTAQAKPEAVLKAVKELGSNYVMFGTDATYYGVEHYERYKPMIQLLQKNLSATDFNRVIRGNAKRVFGL